MTGQSLPAASVNAKLTRESTTGCWTLSITRCKGTGVRCCAEQALTHDSLSLCASRPPPAPGLTPPARTRADLHTRLNLHTRASTSTHAPRLPPPSHRSSLHFCSSSTFLRPVRSHEGSAIRCRFAHMKAAPSSKEVAPPFSTWPSLCRWSVRTGRSASNGLLNACRTQAACTAPS